MSVILKILLFLVLAVLIGVPAATGITLMVIVIDWVRPKKKRYILQQPAQYVDNRRFYL